MLGKKVFPIYLHFNGFSSNTSPLIIQNYALFKITHISSRVAEVSRIQAALIDTAYRCRPNFQTTGPKNFNAINIRATKSLVAILNVSV